VPADRAPTPRNRSVYVGYASAVAARGAVSVMATTAVASFTSAAWVGQVVVVPHGQHGFDHLDHNDESCRAVERECDEP
jgi:hypothetical protein